jgi:hypothetical protein
MLKGAGRRIASGPLEGGRKQEGDRGGSSECGIGRANAQRGAGFVLDVRLELKVLPAIDSEDWLSSDVPCTRVDVGCNKALRP